MTRFRRFVAALALISLAGVGVAQTLSPELRAYLHIAGSDGGSFDPGGFISEIDSGLKLLHIRPDVSQWETLSGASVLQSGDPALVSQAEYNGSLFTAPTRMTETSPDRTFYRFDGVDDFLRTNVPITIGSTYSIFLVFRNPQLGVDVNLTSHSPNLNVDPGGQQIFLQSTSKVFISLRRLTVRSFRNTISVVPRFFDNTVILVEHSNAGTGFLSHRLFQGGDEEAMATTQDGTPSGDLTDTYYVGSRGGNDRFAKIDLMEFLIMVPRASAGLTAGIEVEMIARNSI